MKGIGRIIRIISNQYTVLINEKKYLCTARGKFRKEKISPVVGDIVEVDTNLLTIEKITSRRNYLTRPVVANVDIALIVTSVKKPDLSLNLLDKLISIITIHKIEPIICFSKLDLVNEDEKLNLREIIDYYQRIGIKVVTNENVDEIKTILKDQVVVVTGQTGAGKSTLLNKLDSNLNLETKPISEALNRGVHTTRHVELYKIDDFLIVDTPGFSALDFKNITADELKESFKEFGNSACEFNDCLHDKEKNCWVKRNVDAGLIRRSRYDNYRRFLGEIYESNRKLYK